MYKIDKLLATLNVFMMIPDAEQQSMKKCCDISTPWFLDHYNGDGLTGAMPNTNTELLRNQRSL